MPSHTNPSFKPTSGPATEPNMAAAFLPDFCQLRALLLVVIIAELLAFVLTLAPMTSTQQRWGDLGLISLFVQWIALTSTAMLCLSKRWFKQLNVTATTFYSLFVVTGITALVSAIAYHLILSNSLGSALAGFEGLTQSSHHAGFILRNVAISLIICAVALRYFYVQHQSRLSIRAEARSRLHALQARIRPHFLFNSMNTIASLTRSNPELAETVVEDLADLFRNNLNTSNNATRLADEIDLTRRYLNIEQLRLGERLQTQWRVDMLPDNAAVPPLLLQPLVENAVYHGIEPCVNGGCIRIQGRFEADMICLTISNPLPITTTPQGTQTNSKGLGMALENTRQRLAGWYEGEGHLATENKDGQFIVTLTLPYQRIGDI
ncbi:MAG: histidine kinase [Gammaproteobacteria bacterium]|nr:histidine kinase [Gammaproteobacteria bacterium]